MKSAGGGRSEGQPAPSYLYLFCSYGVEQSMNRAQIDEINLIDCLLVGIENKKGPPNWRPFRREGVGCSPLSP